MKTYNEVFKKKSEEVINEVIDAYASLTKEEAAFLDALSTVMSFFEKREGGVQ